MQAAVEERKWLGVAVAALVAIAGIIVFQALEIRDIDTRMTLARDSYSASIDLLTLVINAETGQRGYLLTGSEHYLAPYRSAVASLPTALGRFEKTMAAAGLHSQVPDSVRHKFAELATTIRLFREGNLTAALQVVHTDQGNAITSRLRSQLDEFAAVFGKQISQENQTLARLSTVLDVLCAGALVLVALTLVLLSQRIRRVLAANAKLETDLEEHSEAFRLLALRFDEFGESERARIARDLHDELGQYLTGIKMDVARAKFALNAGDRERFEATLNSAVSHAEEGIRSVRRIATQLRPPQLDHLGLGEAIKACAEEFSVRFGTPVEVSFPELRRLSEPQEVALYRAVQESLTNVARHAQASKVKIDAEVENAELKLTVEDDGVGTEGLAKPSRSLGLLGIAERAKAAGGHFSFESQPGSGTRVVVRVPMPAVKAMNA